MTTVRWVFVFTRNEKGTAHYSVQCVRRFLVPSISHEGIDLWRLGDPQWRRGERAWLRLKNHMRRSSLGSGRGRPGFSDPDAPVCFVSSALGLYVPSILLFFLITHSSSSRVKLSRDSTVDTNTDTEGGTNACIATVTDSCGGNRTQKAVTVNRCKIRCLLQIKKQSFWVGAPQVDWIGNKKNVSTCNYTIHILYYEKYFWLKNKTKNSPIKLRGRCW